MLLHPTQTGCSTKPMKAKVRLWSALTALVLLSACGRLIPEGRPAIIRPPVAQPVAAKPAVSQPDAPQAVSNALVAGVHAGPLVSSLSLTAAATGPALVSFRESCPRLIARQDRSGLTQNADWQSACTAANGWAVSDAQHFFEQYFEAAVVGDGGSYVTGYYEPEIAGVRTHQPGFDVPVYGVPADLVHAKPGEATPGADGQMPLGRYDVSGKFVAYFDRAEIENGALSGRGLEIGWAADAVEFYFLQVQGSGRLRGPDNTLVRIGYAGQNGQPYTGIGLQLRQRGLIGTGAGQYAGSMQGIMAYLREHPEDGRALMRENKAWVFFRELTGEGAIGALGVPVRGRVSLAADPQFVPLGAPVLLALDRIEANGLWVAQDTGGAIKGANRFDSFWGAGPDARRIAGGMSGRGQALILLPKGVLARLGAQ